MAGDVKLVVVAHMYTQTAYAGLTKSLQSKWKYMQQVVLGLEDKFQPIKTALTDHFLPVLLK